MRRTLILVLALGACGGGGRAPAPGSSSAGEHPIRFRIISEGQNPAFCVRGPEFDVAVHEAAWRRVHERQGGCQPGARTAPPRVEFSREIAVAAWWRVQGCLGYRVTTESVTRTRSNAIVVTASSRGPSGVCAQTLGGLESFLAIGRADASGTTVVRFVLDGAFAGSVPMPS
jgi:hypothetical protein